MEGNEKKLKPVVFIRGDYNKRYLQNTLQQKVLLKAMQITDDPKELRRMIGVKSVVDVYRTLDKMSLRKELHVAMAKHGVTWEYVVGRIKHLADSASKDDTQLKALQTFLRSFGLDKYEEADSPGGKTWEDLLADAAKRDQNIIEGTVVSKKYEVNAPKIPDDEKKRIEEERRFGESLYEGTKE